MIKEIKGVRVNYSAQTVEFFYVIEMPDGKIHNCKMTMEEFDHDLEGPEFYLENAEGRLAGMSKFFGGTARLIHPVDFEAKNFDGDEEEEE